MHAHGKGSLVLSNILLKPLRKKGNSAAGYWWGPSSPLNNSGGGLKGKREGVYDAEFQ